MEVNELVVESMEHCFVCLNPIKSQNEFSVDAKHEPDIQTKYSLSSLSSYLKMDMGKVFNDNDSIPQQLMDKVRKSKLKGELCDECSLMNEQFSESYRKLVKIELELASALQLFQRKFLNANEAGKEDSLRHLVNSMGNSRDGWTGKLDILEMLRAEAIRRCSQKLKCSNTLCVRVQKLTVQQVIIEKQKFNSNVTMETSHNPKVEALSYPEDEFENVKTDYPDPLLDDTGDYSDYQDMDMSYPNEGSTTSAINKIENGISVHPSSQPDFSDARTNRDNDDMNTSQVNDLFVVIVPPESRNVPKPQSSLNPKTGKYKCNLCPKEVLSQSSFKKHYDSVHLKVKYKCTICGSQFTQRCQYNLHHRSIHMGVRLKCLGCDKIFKYKSHLTQHQRKDCCNKTLAKAELL